MNDSLEHLPEDEALDQLLAQARWPEPDAESLATLKQTYWSERSSRSLRIGLACSAVAAAAIILIAIGFGLTPHRGPTQIAINPPAPPPAKITPTIQSRPANLAEQAILYSVQPPPPLKRVAPPKPLSLDGAFAQIDDGESPRDIARTLLGQYPSETLEQKLIANLDQEAAIALLCEISTPSRLSRLADKATDPTHRRQLLTALIRRDETAGVSAYLKIVEDPTASPELIAALAPIPEPVISELFKNLDDSYVSRRMLAARALGRIDGPIITQRLADMVRRNENRREALAALVSSEGFDATRFVERAKRMPKLAAEIRIIQTELNNPL